jgi:hypothetical protein
VSFTGYKKVYYSIIILTEKIILGVVQDQSPVEGIFARQNLFSAGEKLFSWP